MIIQLENITKSYPSFEGESQQVLRQINFTVSNADSVAIIGPSGSGKSTLLNLMGILDQPSSGKIIFKGTEIEKFSENERAELRNKNIGFVFQQHHLLPQLSLLENILVPVMAETSKQIKTDAYKRALELIEMVGLKGKENRLPGQLSVGECQRTAVVRALINQPEIILADEPTGSLDEASALNLVMLLCEISNRQKTALVMVTHSTDLASKMNKTFKLQSGILQS